MNFPRELKVGSDSPKNKYWVSLPKTSIVEHFYFSKKYSKSLSIDRIKKGITTIVFHFLGSKIAFSLISATSIISHKYQNSGQPHRSPTPAFLLYYLPSYFPFLPVQCFKMRPCFFSVLYPHPNFTALQTIYYLQITQSVFSALELYFGQAYCIWQPWIS